MAWEENHNACKRSRVGVGNGGSGPAAAKLGQRGQHLGDGEEDGEGKAAGGVRGGLRPWHHPSSRIFRVSRASGGKDRHSKVYTSKGLRDRRVRLSVSTAIQFYDLQDRLGYDQPSKAIEWLIKKAASSIAELPTLESSFPEPLKLHPGVEKPELDTEMLPVNDSHQQHQHLSLTKSGCSSTSETSKGSVLSLSRSENRVKARERARERAAKEKDRDECDGHVVAQHQNVNPSLNPQSSFTELLTGSGSGSNGAAVTTAQVNSSADCIQKQIRYLPVTSTADYLAHAGLFVQETHQPPSGFAHLGNSSPMGMMPFNMAAAAAAAAAGEHSEMHQFSFFQDHPIPIAAVAAGDYNLNFSISPGLAGFNRGTLQSNSPSQLPHHHLQRLSSPADRSNLPFFFGAAPSASAAASAENPFPAGFDGRLQLCYSDGFSHSDVKGKGKS